MKLNPDLMARLFPEVEPEALSIIEAKAKLICRCPPNYILNSPIDPSERVILLEQGVIELVSENRGAIWHYGSGSLLGLETLSARAYPYTAVTRTLCRLLVLENSWFKVLAYKYPGLQSAINAYSQQHQREWEDYQSQMLSLSRPGRVALALLNLSRAVEGGVGFPFKVTWWTNKRVVSEMLLSVCPPKVREALKLMQQAGILKMQEGDYQQALPPILQEHSTEKLERLISTTLRRG